MHPRNHIWNIIKEEMKKKGAINPNDKENKSYEHSWWEL